MPSLDLFGYALSVVQARLRLPCLCQTLANDNGYLDVFLGRDIPVPIGTTSKLGSKNREREVSPNGETEAFGVSRNHFDNNEL